MKTPAFKRFTRVLFLSGSFLFPSLVRGAVIFDSSNLGAFPVLTPPVNASSYQAQSFVFSGGPSELSTVTLLMNSVTTGGGNFFVALYDNGPGNVPGISLLPLSGEVNPAAAGSYRYSPGSALNLAAGNTYWVVAGVSSGAAQYEWSYGIGAPGTGSEGVNGGASYDLTAQNPQWSPYGTGQPFIMTVEAVPEPSLVGLIAVAVCGVGIGFRTLSTRKKLAGFRRICVVRLPHLLFVAGLLLSPVYVRGTIIFDSSNISPGAGVGAVEAGSYQAQSFVLGASSVELTDVALLMNAAPVASGNDFFVAIYNNAPGNLPGSSLMVLSGSANPATQGTYHYAPTSTLNLNAGAAYWVVAGVNNPASTAQYDWTFGDGITTTPGVGAEGPNGWASSANQGADWTAGGQGTPYRMTIDGLVPIPEPAECGALAVAVCSAVIGLRALTNRRRP